MLKLQHVALKFTWPEILYLEARHSPREARLCARGTTHTQHASLLGHDPNQPGKRFCNDRLFFNQNCARLPVPSMATTYGARPPSIEPVLGAAVAPKTLWSHTTALTTLLFIVCYYTVVHCIFLCHRLLALVLLLLAHPVVLPDMVDASQPRVPLRVLHRDNRVQDTPGSI